MNDNEFIEFLTGTLLKVENVINLLEQDVPKHIPAYNKILGVQQKLAGLNENYKICLFPQLITTRSVINYFMNGRYGDGYQQVMKLKRELIKICLEIKNNEKDTNK